MWSPFYDGDRDIWRVSLYPKYLRSRVNSRCELREICFDIRALPREIVTRTMRFWKWTLMNVKSMVRDFSTVRFKPSGVSTIDVSRTSTKRKELYFRGCQRFNEYSVESICSFLHEDTSIFFSTRTQTYMQSISTYVWFTCLLHVFSLWLFHYRTLLSSLFDGRILLFLGTQTNILWSMSEKNKTLFTRSS